MPITRSLTSALIDGTGAITPANVSVSTNNLTVGNSFYVIANGNVGVGNSAPVQKLHIYGSNTQLRITNTLSGNNSVPGLTQIQFYGMNNGQFEAGRIEIADTSNESVGSNLKFYVGNTSGGLSERMIIVANGNIGIGNSTPSYKVVVDGIVGGANSRFAVGAGLSAAAPDYSFASDGSMGMFRLPGVLGFSTGGTERMRIDASGRLAIGTNSAVGSLDVLIGNSTVPVTVAKFGSTGNGNTNRGSKIVIAAGGLSSNVDVVELVGYQEAPNTVANAASFAINVANTSGNLLERMRIDSGGNITITGNTTANGIAAGYAPNRPAFRVYGSGTTNNLGITVNTTGALNANNWAVDYNQGSYLSGTTGVFTAPVAGIYQVNMVIRNSGNTSGIMQAAVVKNATGGTGGGGSVACMVEFGANSSMNHAGVGTALKLAVNDTLALKVLAGTINFDSNDSWSLSYIG